jgi:hypothetical protein
VDPALGFAQEPERLHGALTHPVRQGRSLENFDQLADVAMGRVVMIVGVGMGVRLVDEFAGRLLPAVREPDVDLGRLYAAAVYLLDVNSDVEAQALGQAPQPCHRRASGHKSAQQHVAADARRRVQDGKASI